MDVMELDEAVVDQETNACTVRPKLIKRESNPSSGGSDLIEHNMASMREENNLNQIYKLADFVCNNCSNLNKKCVRAKYQLMVTRALSEELLAQEAQRNPGGAPSTESLKLLTEMLKPLMQFFVSYEDTWNGMIYDDSDQKTMSTSLAHQELTGFTTTRIKYLQFFMHLCERSLDFESLKDIYKRELAAIKFLDHSVGLVSQFQPGSQTFHFIPTPNCTLVSLKILFSNSMCTYISVLCAFIRDQLTKYKFARQAAIGGDSSSAGAASTSNKWKAN